MVLAAMRSFATLRMTEQIGRVGHRRSAWCDDGDTDAGFVFRSRGDSRTNCHPERSEGSNGAGGDEILRYAQDDRRYAQDDR